VITLFLRFVIAAAADVFVRGRQRVLGLDGLDWRRLQAELEDRFDVPVAGAIEVRGRYGTRASSLEAGDAVAIAEADHAQHGPVRELWSCMPTQHSLDHLGDVRTESGSPGNEARWRPLAVLAVCVRSVLVVGHSSALCPVAARM
jgi:hypothetical protein